MDVCVYEYLVPCRLAAQFFEFACPLQTLRTYQVFECMTRELGRSEHEQASEHVASFMANANSFFRMLGDWVEIGWLLVG